MYGNCWLNWTKNWENCRNTGRELRFCDFTEFVKEYKGSQTLGKLICARAYSLLAEFKNGIGANFLSNFLTHRGQFELAHSKNLACYEPVIMAPSLIQQGAKNYWCSVTQEIVLDVKWDLAFANYEFSVIFFLQDETEKLIYRNLSSDDHDRYNQVIYKI